MSEQGTFSQNLEEALNRFDTLIHNARTVEEAFQAADLASQFSSPPEIHTEDYKWQQYLGLTILTMAGLDNPEVFTKHELQLGYGYYTGGILMPGQVKYINTRDVQKVVYK